jgi:hypothetical protein
MIKMTANNKLIGEALRIVDGAKEHNITMRMLGASAILVHCPKFAGLYEELGRELTDLDFMAYLQEIDQVAKFITSLGYTLWFTPVQFGSESSNRYIFTDQSNGLKIDVFFDNLVMCHTIPFRNRLEIDYPTISLVDLFLEKMQIVEINEKDIKDTIVLLREHEIGETDDEEINVNYIEKLCSDDWGLYYTVVTNLKKIREKFLEIYHALSDDDRARVKLKINAILDNIEQKPKSLKWKIRSKIGTKAKWYRSVDTIHQIE